MIQMKDFILCNILLLKYGSFKFLSENNYKLNDLFYEGIPAYSLKDLDTFK